MRVIYILGIILCLGVISCGKSNPKKNPKDDTASIDTASVEQLEKELKDLETQSNRVNEKLDSINNVINE